MDTMKKNLEWIHNHTVCNNGGIIVTTNKPVLYPEVTGYYIPSLLNVGETSWLSHLQKKCAKFRSWMVHGMIQMMHTPLFSIAVRY